MKVPRYVRQILKPPTLDLEAATNDAFYIIANPRKVYRTLYYKQQSKAGWARDDPSFIVVVAFLVGLSTFFWGLILHRSTIGAIGFMLYSIIVDFLALGSLVAYITYIIISKFLLKRNRTEVKTELSYCFDVHCYSYIATWLWLHIIQLVLLPVITKAPLGFLVGNIVYMAALTHYLVITFLGFSSLSYVDFPQLFLLPVPVIILVGVICSLCHFSIAKFMLTQYLN